jgi:NADH dehydrogenase
MMGSLGRNTGFGQFLGVHLHGLMAWFIRRTYYLLQMPGWRRRFRIMIDWTFGLLFRPDIVKLGLDSETALLLREVGPAEATTGERGASSARTESANKGSSLHFARTESKSHGPALVEQALT